MRRFTKIIAVKKFATVGVVQDGDRKQFEIYQSMAEELPPCWKQVGPAISYDDGFGVNSVREQRLIAHGAANRLAASLLQAKPAGDDERVNVEHMSHEWAARSVKEVEELLERFGVREASAREPLVDPALLSSQDEEALDEAAAAAAQGLSPEAQEARRRP